MARKPSTKPVAQQPAADEANPSTSERAALLAMGQKKD